MLFNTMQTAGAFTYGVDVGSQTCPSSICTFLCAHVRIIWNRLK